MELIRCPAPLPEDSATPVLTRMLTSVSYQAPAGEGEKIQDDLGSGGKSDTEPEEIDLSSPEDAGGKGSSTLLLTGGKGPPPKIGRSGLPRGARCHRRAAWVWKATLLNSFNKGTSPQPNRE